ncbi:MAG: arylsulfotransferase family protein [Acidimicrobiia bacterium]
MVDGQEAAWAGASRGWTRRQFVRVGAAGVLAGGAAYAGVRALGTDRSPSVARFRSRPDLTPPVVEVLTGPAEAGGSTGSMFLTPTGGAGQAGPLVVDGRGSPVWVNPRPGVLTANLRVQTYHELPVLTWWEGREEAGVSDGEWVVVDQTYTEVARVRAANGLATAFDDLVITPWHTALVLASAPVAGGRILESVVQEVDIGSGAVRFEWHSAQHVGVEESSAPPPATGSHDYFHATSVDLDEEANLVVSARNTSAIYRIANPTGEVLWRLGGTRSDFGMGPGAAFAGQHDAGLPAAGQVAMFDNAGDPTRSRGLILSVDTPTGSASVRRQFVHPHGGRAATGGNLQLLDDDGVFIGWGSLPYFSEFGPDGRLRFDARFRGGNTTYRAFRLPWTAQPEAPPHLTVEIGEGGRATVYASWNGATEVAEWVVLTGRGDTLEPVASSPRTGFETAIRLPDVPPYVAVSAVDAAGDVLATSQRVQLPG